MSGEFRHPSRTIWRSLFSPLASLTRFLAILTADSALPLLWLCRGELAVCWNSHSRVKAANWSHEYWGPLSVIMSAIPCRAKCDFVLITDSCSQQSLGRSHFHRWRDPDQPLTIGYLESYASLTVSSFVWLESPCKLHSFELVPWFGLPYLTKITHHVLGVHRHRVLSD